MEHSSKAKAGAVQFLQLKIFSCFLKKEKKEKKRSWTIIPAFIEKKKK